MEELLNGRRYSRMDMWVTVALALVIACAFALSALVVVREATEGDIVELMYFFALTVGSGLTLGGALVSVLPFLRSLRWSVISMALGAVIGSLAGGGIIGVGFGLLGWGLAPMTLGICFVVMSLFVLDYFENKLFWQQEAAAG